MFKKFLQTGFRYFWSFADLIERRADSGKIYTRQSFRPPSRHECSIVRELKRRKDSLIAFPETFFK